MQLSESNRNTGSKGMPLGAADSLRQTVTLMAAPCNPPRFPQGKVSRGSVRRRFAIASLHFV